MLSVRGGRDGRDVVSFAVFLNQNLYKLEREVFSTYFNYQWLYSTLSIVYKYSHTKLNVVRWSIGCLGCKVFTRLEFFSIYSNCFFVQERCL